MSSSPSAAAAGTVLDGFLGSSVPAPPLGLGLAALGRPGYINLGHGEDLTSKGVEEMRTQASGRELMRDVILSLNKRTAIRWGPSLLFILIGACCPDVLFLFLFSMLSAGMGGPGRRLRRGRALFRLRAELRPGRGVSVHVAAGAGNSTGERDRGEQVSAGVLSSFLCLLGQAVCMY
jgi:hypothetical protein